MNQIRRKTQDFKTILQGNATVHKAWKQFDKEKINE